MKHIGIITEYNPFHNGHAYQIEQIKKKFPEKKILVVMSGDFVQRGEPAIFNKYLRTQCALSAGVDLVFELPSLFATASAEYFATAAVLALAKTEVVDTLCFGAEHDDLDAFYQIATLLLEEPSDYQKQLKIHLKSGLSYPKARTLAIAHHLQNERYTDILRNPNNILAIEYIKAILKYHLDLRPYIIKRKGSGYHELQLDPAFSSASALRNHLSNLNPSSVSPAKELAGYVPASSSIHLKQQPFAKPLFSSDFYPFLQYKLWENRGNYEDYFEVTPELCDQLSALSLYPENINDLIEHLSGKNYTRTRLNRMLLNILLQHHKQDMELAKQIDFITYLRILGFQKNASFLLKEMKKSCPFPIINKVSTAYKQLSAKSLSYFSQDLHNSMLYKQVYRNKYQQIMPSEYEHSVIIHDL